MLEEVEIFKLLSQLVLPAGLQGLGLNSQVTPLGKFSHLKDRGEVVFGKVVFTLTVVELPWLT